ncbi:MAG TPA: hypothetical protein VHO28_06580, partial [Ignavibacteriales bacterium]|nr:hypothetical protein [Ignavibacteriales bacterium]
VIVADSFRCFTGYFRYIHISFSCNIADSAKLAKCLNTLVEKDIRTKGELQLTDALQLLIDEGEAVTTFPVDGWYDCGKPETLLSTNQFLLDRTNTKKGFDSVVIIPPVFIAEGSVVKNSVIGPYATISEGSIITESIIKNSIIGPKAIIDKALLENSIVGGNAFIKGNFQRLNAGDSSEIEIY